MMLLLLPFSGALSAASADRAEGILTSREDLLAREVLAQGEPRYETVADRLPPLVGYVPISSPSPPRKLVIDEQGVIGYLLPQYGPGRLQPLVFDPRDHVSLPETAVVRGELIDGHLPGVRLRFTDADGRVLLTETAFSLPGEPESTYVELASDSWLRCFELPAGRETDPVAYRQALATFREVWAEALQTPVRLTLPEPLLVEASLAAIARSTGTFVGDHPKYGLGAYAEDVHDGFPPTVLWMGNACLEWGLFDRAHDYLTYYFDRFVREDGTFDYYGPAVSEYGQMLDLVARYVRHAGDAEWLKAHRPKVAAMAQVLVRLREESLAQPPEAPTRGLLYGSPEADTREQTEYHFSGTAWAARGLLELARLTDDPPLEGCAASIRRDLNRAARGSVLPGDPPFLPPYPGLETPFPTMTTDTLASYTNYRYWPELLSAGVLDAELAETVFEYRRRQGGELCATTRFADRLDDWPLAHQARALLAADRVDQYLLALYGHLVLQQTPGTYCAYEQVAIRGGDTRSYAADYCVPAQLTVPLLVRWMLVWEEPDEERLWLCRAIPRRWLAPGETVRVRHVPTRWGPVSFEVHAETARVHVNVTPPPALRGAILVRLRRPDGAAPVAMAPSDVRFSPHLDALELRCVGEPVEIEATYTP